MENETTSKESPVQRVLNKIMPQGTGPSDEEILEQMRY